MAKRVEVRDTNRTGQIGVSWVTWIVEGLWGCGVEVVSAHNDNSVDVLIFLKRRERASRGYAGPTGDVVFAQIKTGYRRSMPPAKGTYGLSLGRKHNLAHAPRWLSMPGPAIMIHVTPPSITMGEPIAHWTDLKDPQSFPTPAQVAFDVRRKLDADGKNGLYNLCWRWAELRKLPVLQAPSEFPWATHMPIQAAGLAKGFHASCRAFYAEWMKQSKAKPSHFVAQVTNRGWRHMTRVGRPKRTMFQSLLLLPVAASMLQQSAALPRRKLGNVQHKTDSNGREWKRHYEAVTARVKFYERQEAVVRVIIECTELLPAPATGPNRLTTTTRCLYSVYELARRR